jgi:hypothetical protein
LSEWRVVKAKIWERFRWIVRGKSKKDELSRVVKANGGCFFIQEKRVRPMRLAWQVGCMSGIEKLFSGNLNNG